MSKNVYEKIYDISKSNCIDKQYDMWSKAQVCYLAESDDKHIRVKDLLSLPCDNSEFIDIAYWSMLGILCDETSRAKWLKNLNDGEFRLRLLYQIANSNVFNTNHRVLVDEDVFCKLPPIVRFISAAKRRIRSKIRVLWNAMTDESKKKIKKLLKRNVQG